MLNLAGTRRRFGVRGVFQYGHGIELDELNGPSVDESDSTEYRDRPMSGALGFGGGSPAAGSSLRRQRPFAAFDMPKEP